MVLIGIDPDVDKSGVAIKTEKSIVLLNLSFFDLFDKLKTFDTENTKVVVEGGWLNKSNWHTKSKENDKFNAEIGRRTGANLETGKKIVEMLVYLKLKHTIVRPSKMKVNSSFFKKITGIARSNQEQRDAYMIIHE